MTLNEKQKKSRAEVLKDMVRAYRRSHPRVSMVTAVDIVISTLDEDPVKLRIVNAIAASTCK